MAELTLVSTTVVTSNVTFSDSGDWIYYKAASLERRSGGGSLFSDISYINTQFQGTNGAGNTRQFNWSNGTPTATGVNVTGNRYERSFATTDTSGEVITCRVDSGVRTYKIHVGYYVDGAAGQGASELEVELSDASASPISSFPTLTIGADTELEFVIDAASATDNQTITFRWRNNTTVSNVSRYVTIRAAEVTDAASGGTTINGNLGTATASGYQANVDVQTNINGALGTASAIGYQANISADTQIDCALGTATASGFAASIVTDTTINCALGTADASGFQASITTGGDTTINGNLGTADATGYQANIDIQTTILCSVGTANASGYQASINSDVTIACNLGTADASGFNATIQYTTGIDCSLGIATAFGYTATISVTAPGYGIVSDIQSLTPGALVEMFEIDLLPIGINEQYYFHNDVNELGNDVTWQAQVYTRFPIEADGFEKAGAGTQPRPTVRIGNVTGLISALSSANDDLVGVKVTRRRTFLQYLDAVNFASGNATADSNVHLPDEIWFIDRKSVENRIFIEWELRSASDLTNVSLPKRQCIQNVCLWRYRSAECSYTGGAVADVNDVATTDLGLDVCGKRMESCRLRFPYPDELPFGGYPAIGLIR